MSQQKTTERLRFSFRRFEMRKERLGKQNNEIAAALGIEPSAISNWRSQNGAKPSTVLKLAELLGCRYEWLMGEGEDDEPSAREPSAMRDDAGESELAIWKRRAILAERRLLSLREDMKAVIEANADSPVQKNQQVNSHETQEILRRAEGGVSSPQKEVPHPETE